jgi:hypothetical protein
MMTERDPQKARDLIAGLKADTDDALETLRDLARGIYPPLLMDQGLGGHCGRRPARPLCRWLSRRTTSSAIPRRSSSGLFLRTRGAAERSEIFRRDVVGVRLFELEHQIVFEVDDDGRGFDRVHAVRGAGLTNMDDRLDALGGSLRIASEAETLTRLGSRLINPRAGTRPAQESRSGSQRFQEIRGHVA